MTGGERTFEQYVRKPLIVNSEQDTNRQTIEATMPPEHLEFLGERPFYHEDNFALYVHAGLESGKTSERNLATITAVGAGYGFL